MPSLQDQIDAFLAGSPFAVCGASPDRKKYGNKVLRCYLQNGLVAIPINPTQGMDVIEGVKAFPRLAEVPSPPGPIHAVSIITPSPVTEKIVEQMGELGITHVWMQPGAESPKAVARARELGMNVIAGGPCILVALGFHDH